MDKFRNYDIAFSGLKTGKHEFKFEIDKAFFNLFDTEQEFTNPKISAEVVLDKHTTFLELWISVKGTIELVCDISTENFDYPIENDMKVLVKYGEEFDDSDIDVITIPQSDHAVNIAQLLYETIVLSVPMKKVSPNINEEVLKNLEKFSPKIEEKPADPRWEALQKLKDKK